MIQPIILAAGKGTRMRTEAPKALFVVGGVSMIERMLSAYKGATNTKEPLVVVGHKADEIMDAVGGARFVRQETLDGTASAVRACVPYLEDGDHVCITYVDHPYFSTETFQKLVDASVSEPDALVLGTVKVPDFSDWYQVYEHFGRIIENEDGTIDRIVEYKNATEDERAITLVNPGVYLVSASWLTENLAKIERNELTGEYYLTDIIGLAKQEGKRILSMELPAEEAIGINSPEDALLAEKLHTNRE